MSLWYQAMRFRNFTTPVNGHERKIAFTPSHKTHDRARKLSIFLSKVVQPLFWILFLSHPQLQAFASDISPPVNYRYMALYQLKLNRYNYPSDSYNPDSVRFEHTHHHSHHGFWGSTFYQSSYAIDRDASFSEKVEDVLEGVALAVVIVTLVMATGYTLYRAAWPYLGAASLTSIELPMNSPWKITGYHTIHGGVIRYTDLAFNEDAMAQASEYNMFDKKQTDQGRFILVDQENWWGMVGYPVDVDVIFTLFDDDSGEAIEQAFVNVKRKITNGTKAGAITSEFIQSTRHQQNYQLVTHSVYPDWSDFSGWYHQPARLVVDFKRTEHP